MPSPRVFTIPASAPFLPTLIRALRDGRLVEGFPPSGDPLAWSRATLFLPTRRACALARDAFLDVLNVEAAVLPRIVPLGDIDEDELAFADAASGEAGLDVPPELGGLERRMLLARLVLRWAERLKPEAGETPLIVHSPAAALALADDLANLIDDMTTRQVDWGKLDGLVPDNLDRYWQLTLDFLKIAAEYWPAELKEQGRIDPAARRDLLIEAERIRLAVANGLVIAAGSTGSMPATARLLDTIAKLPHGAVVLPGLDTDLDDASWQLIGGRHDHPSAFGHPQLAMHALLRRIGIARDEVTPLAAGGARERLLSEAMRPSEATERWVERIDAATRKTALDRLAMIEAANAEEEALAIAVALREAAENSNTAALVTPDRALARRVVAALGRWSIAADDSGGDALPDTEAGVFARLVAQAALGGLEPVTLLALVKHARFRLDAPAGAHHRAIAALELAVLRGPRPRPGTKGLAHALATFRATKDSLHGSDPRKRLTNADLDAAKALADRLSVALAALEEIKGAQSISSLAAMHADAVRALSADDAGLGAAFAGEDGVKLAEAFTEIAEQSTDLRVARGDYADLFETAIADKVCRRAGRPGARVRILGAIEARLIDVDRVVLGGLVEGVWPPDARTDPWLSRPMRRDLGLDLPERRIGLSAHDFAQLLGMAEVILTRAAKLAGAPTVASRFTQRLAAVAGRDQWKEVLQRGEKYLGWARSLDHASKATPTRRPRPTPPLDTRPTRLSVTEIEHWLRDPYTIYAKHILKLVPLDAVDTPPGARDRGTVIHGAIGEFTQKYAAGLPADPLAALLALGEKHFAPLQDFPEARAFWWPRFIRIARWFVGWEAVRRASAATLFAEIEGELKMPFGERTFRLRTRADRIEQRADGTFAILDYKTGSTPTERQVRTGLSPQLTLEGAILRAGAFEDVPAGSLSEFAYVSLRGREPAGEEKPIEFEQGTPDYYADRALTKLKGIITRFEDEATPYRSLVSPMWKTRYGDYDHLARVKEWSAGAEDEEGVE
ncbi:MAG: double-strand break repair protein AddB [Alphaproteobacteria bacterium]|nr:MAG: double-strand break repair protein AddB [Alphaproteobacteria bacterium]